MFLSDPGKSRAGRLTKRLLAEGLITPAMLDELHREWNRKMKTESVEKDEQKLSKKEARRKKKT